MRFLGLTRAKRSRRPLAVAKQRGEALRGTKVAAHGDLEASEQQSKQELAESADEEARIELELKGIGPSAEAKVRSVSGKSIEGNARRGVNVSTQYASPAKFD